MPDTALLNMQQKTFEQSVNDEPYDASPLSWLVSVGGLLPPWWSYSRDIALRQFTAKSDHLLGMIYAMTAKVATIPFAVLARDKTIARHVDQALERTDNLVNDSDYLRGWHTFIVKFMFDHYSQDNGSFAQVVGGGPADGPLIGWPFGLLHMDAARMQRTSNPEYPCIYTDRRNNKYKVHYSRVLEMASMPSANLDMHGIGHCAVSRCVNVAQNLIDIATYEQEKMGSRPARMMLVGSNISTADIRKAFAQANMEMNQQQLTRFSKMVAVGNPNAQVTIERIDLASIPDGFSKDESTKLGMAIGALAFGVDYREFMPAAITGATKADAEVQHQKAKGKWTEVLQRIERLINQKYLPPHLQFRFDWRNEEDNQLDADVEWTRAQTAEKNLAAGALSVRTVREKWLEAGVIDDAKFEQLELGDGRLVDGTDILYLFRSDSEDMQQLLELPLSNPTNIVANNPDTAIKAIDAQLDKVIRVNVNTSRDTIKKVTRQAIAALNKLRQQYDAEIQREELDASNNLHEAAGTDVRAGSQSAASATGPGAADGRRPEQSNADVAGARPTV
jgi:hypothetical protein